MSRRRPSDAPGQGSLLEDGPAQPAARQAPTAEQRDAARLTANRVLSASAGTGKTFTLTEIYLGLLAGTAIPSRSEPLRPSKIVAVTFTEKAAAELRDRVRRELEERVASGGLSPEAAAHLRSCREELPGAPVSTIHAFCARLLREAGERPGVPAGFAVMEEDDTSELLDRALSDAAAEALASSAAPELRELAREWGVGAGSDFGLVPLGRSLVRALRTRGGQPAVLAVAHSAEESLARATAILEGLFEAIRAVPGKGKSKPSPDLLARVAQAPKAANLEDARRVVLEIASACSGKNGKLLTWAENADLEPAFADALTAAHAPYRKALADYLASAMERFQREKRQRGALDFDDLLLEARRLLREDPAIARAYGFVLIDEFQDTNPLQKDVLYRIAFPPDGMPNAKEIRLAIVGDVKQSIYRFRGADVSAMETACGSGAAGGAYKLERKDLRQNFRSRRAVLDWINAFCAHSLWPVAGAAALRYDETHRLVPEGGARRHEWAAPAGERLVRPDSMEKSKVAGERWRQALAIARRIRALVAPAGSDAGLARPRIWEKREKRFRDRVRYGDIAVLARSLKQLRAPLELALGKMGVPFRMLGGVNFYTRPEILDVLNLLAWTADPTDTSALLGLLRSPLIHLSDGAVFMLMQCFEEKGGAEALSESLALGGGAERLEGLAPVDRDALARGADLLQRLRKMRGGCTAAELIDMACARTGFLSVLAMRPQGEVAVAAVRRLIESSRSFESRGARTLGDFVDWLREKADAEWNEPGRGGGPDLTPDLPESQDAVQIGTVHSAKGLEFPIVVLADIGAASNHSSSHAAYAPEVGLGLRIGMEVHGLRGRADGIHRQAAERDAAEEEAESRRILYVALTRARDYLILTGEFSKSSGTWHSWIGAYEAAAETSGEPRLDRVEFTHAALLAAQADGARGPLRLDGERPRIEPSSGPAPDPEQAARVSDLIEHATEPPPKAAAHIVEIGVSELARYLSCPRRYRLEALSGDSTSQPDDESAEPGKLDEAFEHRLRDEARALGTAAHAALEAAFSAGRAEAARLAWEGAVAEAGLDAKHKEAREALAGVQAVLESPWGRRALSLPPGRRFAERALRWRMDLGGGRTAVLTGSLDLLAGGERAGAWQVVDYKLTKAPQGLAEGRDAESLRRYAWQVGIYALAAARILEVEPSSVEPALLFLRAKDPSPIPIAGLPLRPEIPARISEDSLRAGLASLLEATEAERTEAYAMAHHPPGAVQPELREVARCLAEGCRFVARCFER